MSLETRLKAAFERVAATIKLRGVPAGGTAGQVLTKGSGSDYDAGWATPAAGGEGGSTSVSVTFAGRENKDIASFAAGSVIRKVEFSAAATLGIYANAADRTADSTRLDATPTAAPTANYPVLQLTATGAQTIPALEGTPSGTLYLRASGSVTVTLTLEEL